jgi:hypothetical protein
VVNGSFECPDTVPFGQVGFFDSIPGWTVRPASEGGGGNQIELQNNLTGPAFGGAQVLEMDSFGPTEVEQTIPVQANGTYRLTFAWTPRPDTPAEDNHFRVSIDGEPLVEVGPAAAAANTWQEVTRTFTVDGDATSATITITDLGTESPGDDFDVGALVDGVNVVLID